MECIFPSITRLKTNQNQLKPIENLNASINEITIIVLKTSNKHNKHSQTVPLQFKTIF